MQYKYKAKCEDCDKETEGFGVCGAGKPSEMKAEQKGMVEWIEEDRCECGGAIVVQDIQFFTNEERLWD
jgi:hypothetical protein